MNDPLIGQIRYAAAKDFDFKVIEWSANLPEGYLKWQALAGFYHIKRLDTGEDMWVEAGDVKRNSEFVSAEAPEF